jgi:DNA repair protein RadC
MARFPTIRELSEATPEELTKVKGLGQVKTKKLMAALELGERLYTAPVNSYGPINSPQDVFNLLADMQLLDREYFKAINLNTKNHILAVDTISIGSLNSSVVHPRELFKMAIKRSAKSGRRARFRF